MFLDFYRLTEQPFGVTPDPHFLYLGKTHREALASILHGTVANRGFTALIAGPGMGKTTLVRLLLQKLQAKARTAFLSQSQCPPSELLRSLLASQGIDDSGASLSEMYKKLNDTLMREHKPPKPFVAVIDDAQHLSEPTFELLRCVSNLETRTEKLMHIVLAGQPKLAEKLASPDLTQLRQRVSIFARLEPFSAEETGAYIDHRLRVAHYDFAKPLFTEPALDLIARNTKGIPLNINNVCFHALSVGFVKRQESIDVDVIQEVLQDLDLQALLEAGREVSFVPKLTFGDGNAPAQRVDLNTSVSAFRSLREADLRRSSRIEHPVSLIVFGTDRSGESFEEKTSAVCLNLHGCRYSSCHEYPLGQWVTLRVTADDSDNSSLVRARVRSVLPFESPRELCQVGVELEEPANIWAIPVPPQDWRDFLGSRDFGSRNFESMVNSSRSTIVNHIEERLAGVVSQFAQQQDVARQRADEFAQQLENLNAKLHQLQTEQRQSLAEVQSQLATSNASLPREHAEAVMRSTTEQLFGHLERRLSETASRFEQQHDAARQSYEEITQRLEQLATDTRTQLEATRELAERYHKLLPQNLSMIEQSADRVVRDIKNLAARVSDRQLIRMTEQRQAVARELSLELEARASETRVFLEKAANSTLDVFRRRVEQQIDPAIAEATQRLTSTLGSVDAEYRAAREAQRSAMGAEVARATEQSKAELRYAIKSFLCSCLVAGAGAVDQDAQQTLARLCNDRGFAQRPEAPVDSSTNSGNLSPAANASSSTFDPEG